MKKQFTITLLLVIWISCSFAQQETLKPTVYLPVYFDVSPPLRDMVKMQPEKHTTSWKDGIVKNRNKPEDESDLYSGIPGFTDPGLQDYFGKTRTDTTIQNFPGLGNVSGYVPPDTDGDVSPEYFFQVVNCSYSIYNKKGTKLLGPMASSSIWSGLPNNSNDGDAVILYDEVADRWLFSQFSLPNSTAPYYQMIAISTTSDPTGSWYRYQYEFSKMNDYPKFGIWPDGYYMSSNLFAASFAGTSADCFDRTAMLAGSPTAARISFTLSSSNEAFSLLPSDCDGSFPPMGTPNYFTYVKNGASPHLGIYQFHADFVTPSNSTFGNFVNLPVTAFSSMVNNTHGVPQPETDRKLEALGDRLMYRQQYRNFGSYSSMVTNHTVRVGLVAGVRWYELRNTGSGWSIYQQSTYLPADENSRWMASIAQDSAGNIGLAYSISSETVYPSICYTGRLKNDPLNQMTIAERRIINGAGSQTAGNNSDRPFGRWGDYSALRVDPSNPTTFWYTTEYFTSTSGADWATRIASFSFDNVLSAVVTAIPAKVCAGDSSQLNVSAYGGSGTYTYSWSSIPDGFTSTLQNPKVGPSDSTKYIATTNDGTSTRHDTIQVRTAFKPTVTAGADTTVCWYVTSVELNGSASNYRQFGWSVPAGMGSFTNISSLETTYLPTLAAKIAGSVDIKLVATSKPPCSGSVFSIKHVVFDVCTGVPGQNNPGPALLIQPNPAHGTVSIGIRGNSAGSARLSVTSMDGKTIFSEAIEPSPNPVLKTMDISGYARGIYFVQLKTGNRVLTEKMVVQ